MTFTVLDGIFVLVAVICILLSTKKGFYEIICTPIKLVAAVSITFFLASFFIDNLTGPFFREKISESICSTLLVNYPDLSAANAAETMPFMFKLFAFVTGVDLSNVSMDAGKDGTVASAIGYSIGNPLGSFVAMLVTYVGLFILVSLIIKLVLMLIGGVVTAGPLNVVDKILGFTFGVAVTALICCIVATIVNAVNPSFEGGFLYDFFISLNPFFRG